MEFWFHETCPQRRTWNFGSIKLVRSADHGILFPQNLSAAQITEFCFHETCPQRRSRNFVSVKRDFRVADKTLGTCPEYFDSVHARGARAAGPQWLASPRATSRIPEQTTCFFLAQTLEPTGGTPVGCARDGRAPHESIHQQSSNRPRLIVAWLCRGRKPSVGMALAPWNLSGSYGGDVWQRDGRSRVSVAGSFGVSKAKFLPVWVPSLFGLPLSFALQAAKTESADCRMLEQSGSKVE